MKSFKNIVAALCKKLTQRISHPSSQNALSPKEEREKLLKDLKSGSYQYPRMKWRVFQSYKFFTRNLSKEQKRNYQEYMYKHGLTKNRPE